jgi:hypothetical protein
MFTVMLTVALVASCFTIAVLAMDASLDDVHKAFYDNNIFGDVMPATNFSCLLGLRYTLEGETNVDIFSGIHLTKPSQQPTAPLLCCSLTQIPIAVENQPSLHLKAVGQEVDPNRKLALLTVG